jgi:L-ribulose-5-phosphate 4-epimerase
VRKNLVLYTFGNASGISREDGLVVIKPSGVPYAEMKPEHLVVTDLKGNIVEGKLRPSSDLATHLVLYNEFAEIGGVAHTHSEYATAWAQARRSIPCFGTTHADYFHGPVPVTSPMTDQEIAEDYEKNTGHAIVRSLRATNPSETPGVLVSNHGPFAWGEDAGMAAHSAVILEAIARMAYFTLGINSAAPPVGSTLHNKHYLRKHGNDAYYGQVRDKQ